MGRYREVHIWRAGAEGKGYWEDEGIDGRIRLKFIVKRQ
jgi:hypothetical protein